MDSDDRLDIHLNEIWRVCRKIQSTIFRHGFNLCQEFCQYDPKNTGIVSESQFTGVLGKYKSVVGVSDYELREVTDYFRLRNGRVNYLQFCKVVCNEDHNKSKDVKDITTGQEWDDPMHVNVISRPEDRRRLCLILIKIAQVAHLPLRPYFQDYQIVSIPQTVGKITMAHFSRVLHFMKIPLSDDDFLLLAQRYNSEFNLINYVAFLSHIDNILQYLKENNLTDNAQAIIHNFPGRLVDLELPSLPPVNGARLSSNIFRDQCARPKENKNVCDLIFCIQKYAYANRVRICEFLEGFDPLRSGTVTINQFHRSLDNIGVGKFLSQRDFKMLCQRYADPIDTNRIQWRNFQDEIDTVFTIKNLDKTPQVVVKSPPKHIKHMPREGTWDWDAAPPDVRNVCEDALNRIQNRIRSRRLHLHPFFRNFDRLNSGHVRCNQANRILLTNGILLSNQELMALKMRYGNELGFNYCKFLEDADPAEYGIPKLREVTGDANCPDFNDSDHHTDPDNEEYTIRLLSNAKRQMVVKSIPLIDFLQDYDRHREGEILEVDFKRGLDTANIKMTPEEVNHICKIFRSPKRACCVLYRDFCKALNEIFVRVETETSDGEVTAVPLIHLANLNCLDCTLNFDERTQCSQGLMKLAREPDEISNLSSVFKDFDREKCGTISLNQFMRGLTVRNMNYMISSREFDAICKCFGVTRGLHIEFNYREFLNTLDMLFRTGQIKRNY